MIISLQITIKTKQNSPASYGYGVWASIKVESKELLESD